MSSAGSLQWMSGNAFLLAHKCFGREITLEREVSAADGLCGGASECAFPDAVIICEHTQSV